MEILFIRETIIELMALSKIPLAHSEKRDKKKEYEGGVVDVRLG